MESLGYVIAFLTCGLEWEKLTDECEIEEKKRLFIKDTDANIARGYLSLFSGLSYHEKPCYKSLVNILYKSSQES
jgi:hypothetical protein